MLRYIKFTLLLLVILAGPFASPLVWAQAPAWSQVIVSNQPTGTNVRPVNCVTDANGNIILTGWYVGTPQFGSLASLPTGRFAGFVAKLNTRSQQWLWATSIEAGTTGDDSIIESAATTATGDVVVAGYCSQGNKFGALAPVGGSGREAFVAKLDGSTGHWLWATTTAGFGIDNDQANQVTLTAEGDPVITGFFRGTATFGPQLTLTATPSSGNNGFVAKASGSSGQWLWATPILGNTNSGQSITTNGGSVVMGGYFAGTVQFSAGMPPLTSSGSEDTYVAQLSAGTGAWQWATRAGGPDITRSISVAATLGGETFVTGYYSQSAQFGTTTLRSPEGSGSQATFIAKVNELGQWQWATQVNDQYYGPEPTVVSTATGDALLLGTFTGTTTFGPFPALISAGREDIFVAKLLGSTGQWQWATRAGGAQTDIGLGLALSPANEPIAVGICGPEAFFGTLSPAGSGPFVAHLSSTITAAQSQLSESQLELFPNPTNSNFTLRLLSPAGLLGYPTLSATLCNSLGQVVQRQHLTHRMGYSLQTSFDVRSLPAGLYMLYLRGGNINHTHKIIIP